VEPDDVSGLVRGIRAIAQIDRAACRAQAEVEYSLAAMADRVEAWFVDILAAVSLSEVAQS
jgi:UDP-glucose:tetrahydrobiopterin glucosyltransferase